VQWFHEYLLDDHAASGITIPERPAPRRAFGGQD
jgi:hypothetical protein